MPVDLDAVLRDINAIRAEFEQPALDKIPCGKPREACVCPISNALSFGENRALVTIGRWHWTHTSPLLNVDDDDRQLTPTLEAFRGQFDNEEFPELIES